MRASPTPRPPLPAAAAVPEQSTPLAPGLHTHVPATQRPELEQELMQLEGCQTIGEQSSPS